MVPKNTTHMELDLIVSMLIIASGRKCDTKKSVANTRAATLAPHLCWHGTKYFIRVEFHIHTNAAVSTKANTTTNQNGIVFSSEEP